MTARILSLIFCPLVFLSTSMFGFSLSSPNNEIASMHLENTLHVSSKNEMINMQLPHHSLAETHYLSSTQDTLTIILSYTNDTVYIAFLGPKWDDKDEEFAENEEIKIADCPAIYRHDVLDEAGAHEFLYSWAGQKFADYLIQKGTILELHHFIIQSADHCIHLIVCGPNHRETEFTALEYVNNLEIETY